MTKPTIVPHRKLHLCLVSNTAWAIYTFRLGLLRSLLESGVRFIARIDAGDLALPGRLAKQRAYLDAHPEVAALGTWVDVVSMTGAHLFSLKPPTEPATIRRRRFYRSCFVHPAMMLRTDSGRP